MTRKEYIQSLSTGLYGFDDASKADIILEIEDHIDELMLKHRDMTEEEIVAGLEKPEILAASLRSEAGIASRTGQAPGGEQTREGEQPHEEERAEEPRREKKRSTSITIDGEDLNEVIKRALDIARMFRDKKHGDDSDEKPFTREIPAENIKSLAVRCRSADVKVLLSVSGLMLEVSGSSESALHMNAREEGYLEIMTKPGDEEIDEIELRVPATIEQLSISTASGDISVVDRIGDMTLHTASGDIDVQACSGNVVVSSVSGDIELEHCTEDMAVETTSGGVELEMDEQSNRVKIATVSGDVELRYPEDFDAMVCWATVSGDIDHDGVAVGTRTIQIGEGLTPIKISTVSGDITIKRL